MSPDGTDSSQPPTNLEKLHTERVGRNVVGEIRQKKHDSRDLKVSICDLIDNSIDAGATEVGVMYQVTEWMGEATPALLVGDNGKGIPADRMRRCLDLNSVRSEGDEYEPWMLGSFGVGLKDSCIAWGNEITLFSRVKGEEPSAWRLSLSLNFQRQEDDAASDWLLVPDIDKQIDLIPEWNTDAFKHAHDEIRKMDHGTIVLLEDIEAEPEEDEIAAVQAELEDFIAMIFCDYINGIDLGPRKKEDRLTITFNGNPVSALDPFWKDQIGVGPYNGQEGTLLAPPFEFRLPDEEGGMEFTINRYIIPSHTKRQLADSERDGRMTKATGSGINSCRGIYFKRNGRILDGPWNKGNPWRSKGAGMAFSHHTCVRWEFILPPESVNDKDLVPPDKGSVRSTKFNEKILEAKDEIIVWHEEDEIDYGTSQWSRLSGGVATPKRGRSRTSGHDIIVQCDHEGCEARIEHNRQVCDDHLGGRCTNCDDPLGEGDQDYCSSCRLLVCEECGELVSHLGAVCLPCAQESCIAPDCEEKSDPTSDYCLEHLNDVCFVNHCNSLSEHGFKSCSEHRSISFPDSNVFISVDRKGTESPEIEIEGDQVILNLDKVVGITKLIRELRGQFEN